MLDQRSQTMTTGTIWKVMTTFAIPVFFGNLFQQLYNTVDLIIVGNFLGSSALAAVSSSSVLIFLLVSFLHGFATGAGVVIAQLFGARNSDQIQQAVHTSAAFGLIAGLALTIFGIGLSESILIWMNTPSSVMPEAIAYLKVYFLGSMGIVLYNTFVGILQAVGDSKHPLYYLIISSILNLALDIVLIQYFHCGVEGAAWATVISQTLSAFLCWQQLRRSSSEYCLRIRYIRIHWKVLKQMIAIGLPSGTQIAIITLANLVVQTYINGFGEMAMAGFGAYTKIEGFAFIPINSLAVAITTFIGQNLGAQQYERCRQGARLGILSTLIFAEVIGILIFTFAPHLVAVFNENPSVIEFGALRAKIDGFFYFLLAYSYAITAVLRGIGKAFVPMMTMIICWCIIRISFIVFMLPITSHIQTIFWAYPLTWFLSSCCLFLYIKKKLRIPSSHN